MKRIVAPVVLAAAAAVFGGGAAVASDAKPEDVVDFRQGVYKVIGWHFGPLGAMAKGDIPFDRDLAVKNSEIVATMSRVAPDAFVAGSDVGDTRAKPEIWRDADGFRSAMERFQKEAQKLADVSKSGDFSAVRAQVGETGKACKACHDDFRKDRR